MVQQCENVFLIVQIFHCSLSFNRRSFILEIFIDYYSNYSYLHYFYITISNIITIISKIIFIIKGNIIYDFIFIFFSF